MSISQNTSLVSNRIREMPDYMVYTETDEILDQLRILESTSTKSDSDIQIVKDENGNLNARSLGSDCLKESEKDRSPVKMQMMKLFLAICYTGGTNPEINDLSMKLIQRVNFKHFLDLGSDVIKAAQFCQNFLETKDPKEVSELQTSMSVYYQTRPEYFPQERAEGEIASEIATEHLFGELPIKILEHCLKVDQDLDGAKKQMDILGRMQLTHECVDQVSEIIIRSFFKGGLTDWYKGNKSLGKNSEEAIQNALDVTVVCKNVDIIKKITSQCSEELSKKTGMGNQGWFGTVNWATTAFSGSMSKITDRFKFSQQLPIAWVQAGNVFPTNTEKKAQSGNLNNFIGGQDTSEWELIEKNSESDDESTDDLDQLPEIEITNPPATISSPSLDKQTKQEENKPLPAPVAKNTLPLSSASQPKAPSKKKVTQTLGAHQKTNIRYAIPVALKVGPYQLYQMGSEEYRWGNYLFTELPKKEALEALSKSS